MLRSRGCWEDTHGKCSAIVIVQGPNLLFCQCPCHLPMNVAELRQRLADRRLVAELETFEGPTAVTAAENLHSPAVAAEGSDQVVPDGELEALPF